MEFSKVSANLRALAIGVLGKLVVMPFLFITAAVLCGFRGIELVSLMVLFMAPSAVSSYTMAQQMDADGELAGQQVVFTTAFSILTIFLFVLVTKISASSKNQKRKSGGKFPPLLLRCSRRFLLVARKRPDSWKL